MTSRDYYGPIFVSEKLSPLMLYRCLCDKAYLEVRREAEQFCSRKVGL